MITESKARKYLEIARATAKLSKDPSTKVGAIIIGPNNEVRSLGYNGAPRGCCADEDDRCASRPEKYFWMSHAELNAITNAARTGTALDGCSIIVTHFPCMECARALVQAGIKAVWVPKMDEEFTARWQEHMERSLRLFDECGVEVGVIYKGPKPSETYDKNFLYNVGVTTANMLDGMGISGNPVKFTHVIENWEHGFVELTNRLVDFAVMSEHELRRRSPQEYPGVYDYEVSHTFGAWFAENVNTSDEEGRTKLMNLIREFFDQ